MSEIEIRQGLLISAPDLNGGKPLRAIVKRASVREIEAVVLDKNIRVDEGTKFHVFYRDHGASYEFDTEAIISKAAIDATLLFRKPKDVVRTIHRAKARAEVRLPARFKLWTEEGFHEGLIVDLSSIGLKLLTDKSMVLNTFFSISFEIVPGVKLTDLFAHVAHAAGSTGAFIYGVEFMNISPGTIQAIEAALQPPGAEEPETSANGARSGSAGTAE